jgi:hypothetical protein
VEVKDCIIKCVSKWLRKEPMPSVHKMPLLVRTLFREQSDIGWDHFIQGRMSMTWVELIIRQLETKNIKNQKAEQWGTDLIIIYWKNILNMWNQRNVEVLGSTEEEKQEQRKRILIKVKKNNNKNILICLNHQET